MTVGELIEELKKVSPTRRVIMSSDGEGNNYSPLACCDAARYLPDTTWRGSVDHPDEPFEDEDAEKAVDAFVLWPIS